MTTFNGLATSVPFTQMKFVFLESDTPDLIGNTLPAIATNDDSVDRAINFGKSVNQRIIPIGVAAPDQQRPSAIVKRRNKPEHISDLLLVVLDRYGIDANEFMAGLE